MHGLYGTLTLKPDAARSLELAILSVIIPVKFVPPQGVPQRSRLKVPRLTRGNRPLDRAGKRSGVIVKRFWIDIIPKNSLFKKRVHGPAFHLPASMVTTDPKMSFCGCGLKKMSRNSGE